MNFPTIRSTAIFGLTALMLSTGSPVIAAPWHHVRRAPDFHGRVFESFGLRERTIWRGGHWVHALHGSQFGWWWVVGGGWHLFPAPVYPYPTYVRADIPVQQVQPAPAAAAQSWYLCNNPQGYYPYVTACHGVWKEIPAEIPAPPPSPPTR